MIRLRTIWAPALLALALAACGDDHPRGTYAGYAEAEYVHVAPVSGGRLMSLAVRRGDHVEKGQPLFALDPSPYEDRVAQAEAQAAQARAQLENLLTGARPEEVRAALARKASAEAALRKSRAELARTRKLHADGFASGEALDQAQEARARDQAAVEEAQAQIDSLKLGRENDIEAAQAAAEAADAALGEARWQLAERSVTAPLAGRVNETNYREGEMVTAGSPVVSLLPPDHVKVRFFVPEDQMGALETGQRATITCDGCGDPIAAELRFVASDLEFTPPVIFSEETRTDLVVMAEAWPLDTDNLRLRPGQPVTVKVDLGGDAE